ncbi:mobilization protein [Streptomyces sp. DG2A-72]|uniref:mobilization protein n=1 Tax=Streptomyces sp. DG2A-72 TaxID=3051386 RepID=UPI00265BD2C1|nr:mobilization protein [Streptomyces sp. DG2A-72]MDO0935001.1 mobilization protein [Streptomyces sp. DG2A-72]
MHDSHHELHDAQKEINTPTSAPASWKLGHSPAGGASQPATAPGAAEADDRSQGAPVGEAATEGGPQQGEHERPAVPSPGKPRARSRKPRQRPAVSVRLSDSERALAEAGAQAASLTLAGFLAQSGLAAARDLTGVTAAIADNRHVLQELFAARRALTQYGNLLNQAAAALNSDADVPYLNDVIDQVSTTRDRVDEAVQRFIALIDPSSPQPRSARSQYGEAA